MAPAPMAMTVTAARIGVPRPKVVIRGAMMPAVVVMATVEDPCAVLRIAERMKGKKIPRPASVVELA